MAVYQLYREQKIKASKKEIWNFISSPKNLQEITPDSMGFEILNDDLPEKMYPGMIIRYHVRPLLGIKTLWVTEITQVREGEYFIDEQRVGPYSIWHHQHFIEEIDGGILMKDLITYQPPFGILGSIANALIIKSKLKEIFAYRKIAMEKRYGVWEE